MAVREPNPKPIKDTITVKVPDHKRRKLSGTTIRNDCAAALTQPFHSPTSGAIAIDRLCLVFIANDKQGQNKQGIPLHDVSLPEDIVTHYGGWGVCNLLVLISRIESSMGGSDDSIKKSWAIRVLEHFKDGLFTLATALENAPSIQTKTIIKYRTIFIGCHEVSYHGIPKTVVPTRCYRSSVARKSLSAYTKGEGIAVFLTVVSMLTMYDLGEPRDEAFETVWQKVNESLIMPTKHLKYLENIGTPPSQMLLELEACRVFLESSQRKRLEAKYRLWKGEPNECLECLDQLPPGILRTFLYCTAKQQLGQPAEGVQLLSNESFKTVDFYIAFLHLDILSTFGTKDQDTNSALLFLGRFAESQSASQFEGQLSFRFQSLKGCYHYYQFKKETGEAAKEYLRDSIRTWERAYQSAELFPTGKIGFACFTALVTLSALKYLIGERDEAKKHLEEVNRRRWIKIIYYPFVNDKWLEVMYGLHREQNRNIVEAADDLEHSC
ncbi:hypothetical protein EDB80DRAFT_737591 [Ilyonectria destructans]|nr:hypothetical protein EDB80DRAFT_737591 [Ilyonectria destructans]